jgi:(2Fe-2S) ferredoxin
MPAEDSVLAKLVEKLKIGQYQRHIFLCTGPTCCTPEQGLQSWEYLKRRLKELGLSEGVVYRTKVGCLRICCDGPTAVIYPEGAWYRGMTPEVCETVIQKHLLGGKPATEHCFACNPLPQPAAHVPQTGHQPQPPTSAH